MMGWYYGGMGWGGWLIMLVSVVAFWALVASAVVAVFRSGRDDRGSRDDRTSWPPRPDPLSILEERFARGEIDETEYRARADILRTSVR